MSQSSHPCFKQTGSSENIQIVFLGATTFIGKSCFVIKIHDDVVMLDCGAGSPTDPFPDFKHTVLTQANIDLSRDLKAIVITHFHVDHCGAVSACVSTLDYQNPIYVTAPTAAIMPFMLKDLANVTTERQGLDHRQGSSNSLLTEQAFERVKALFSTIDFFQTVSISPSLKLTLFPAGHLLGASCIYLEHISGDSVYYTGDFNPLPDCHLDRFWTPAGLKKPPTVLITEITEGSAVKQSSTLSTSRLQMDIINTLRKGGKILLPVSALGRAEELLEIITTLWDSMLDLKQYKLLMTHGLLKKVVEVYERNTVFGSIEIQKESTAPFQYPDFLVYEQNMLVDPCVIIATPSTLNKGVSLQAFQKIADDENSLVIIPGMPSINSLPYNLLHHVYDEISIDNAKAVPIKCRFTNLSFTSHTDQRGIVTMIQNLRPENVVIVHGTSQKSNRMQRLIAREFGIPAHVPLAEKCYLKISSQRPPTKLNVVRDSVYYTDDPNLTREDIENIIAACGGHLKLISFENGFIDVCALECYEKIFMLFEKTLASSVSLLHVDPN